jgi:hypothetical protein
MADPSPSEPPPALAGVAASTLEELARERLAAVVLWRERPLTSASLAVLVLDDGRVELLDEQGAPVFSAPADGVRTRKGARTGWRVLTERTGVLLRGWSTSGGVPSEREAVLAERERAYLAFPAIGGMEAPEHERLLGNPRAQQLMWRELWLRVLARAGAAGG